LGAGANQLIMSFALEDLQEAGSCGFDYAGANIPSIAAAKATWGGQLVPYYSVRQPNARALALLLMSSWRFSRANPKRPL
jgi:hypothetical protein